MKAPPDRDVAVFAEALLLPVAERAAFLDRACGDDGQLRQKVEALLNSHSQIGSFLEHSPRGISLPARPGTAAGEKPGDRIGYFKLLQQIGEGGCGIVFLAEQEEPVRRRVALKVIKPGMDSKSVIARFEAERQALALMDHPNIAKFFDAGATESGRPYFVMEMVRGVKITEYCDQQSLTTRERLKLFVQVCKAVQHAHQKGVIHRDIKPSNILVTTTMEGVALPVVIDFGIAKATTNQRLTDKTLFTAFEMLIGTPAYMSPEQAELTSVDVDTRTDIYSLGVLLYELLTGFNEAIEWAEKAVRNPAAEGAAKAKAFAVLAMALWQLGQKETARAMLVKGDTLAPNHLPATDTEDIGELWVAWLMARISLDEATTLIQSGSTANRKSGQP